MVELTDSPPYFEHEQYQRDCPSPDCEGEVLFHYANLGSPPVGSGDKVHIVSKCTNVDCGFIDHYEPPLSEEEEEHLRRSWDAGSYHPWDPHYEDPEEELENVFGEEAAEEVISRLEELGYY